MERNGGGSGGDDGGTLPVVAKSAGTTTGGGGTRVRIWGRRFSFPLTLFVIVDDFFRASAGSTVPAPSPAAPFSMREKVAVKPVDAARLPADAG